MRFKQVRLSRGPFIAGEQLDPTVRARDSLVLRGGDLGVTLVTLRGDQVLSEILIPWHRVEQADVELEASSDHPMALQAQETEDHASAPKAKRGKRG